MATNITFHEGAVKDDERSELLNQKGATIWLTGLSASGKVRICRHENAFSHETNPTGSERLLMR